jgi:hypothetical protein
MSYITKAQYFILSEIIKHQVKYIKSTDVWSVPLPLKNWYSVT